MDNKSEYSTTTGPSATCGIEFETTVAHLFGKQFTIGKYCHVLPAARLSEIKQYQKIYQLEVANMKNTPTLA